jgi:hypothetical protein
MVKPWNSMPELIFQGLHSSTATLAVMSNATSRAIADMYDWPHTDKDEMKHLGATLNRMKEKFVEFSTLGISKMVEDFFNDLKRFGNIKLSIWSPLCDQVRFSKEVRLIRHLGNVIKHNNSVLESSTGGRSTEALLSVYGFPDDTPIRWLDIFQSPERDSILKYTYMAYQFCIEILRLKELVPGKGHIVEEEEIVPYMLRHFVHIIPRHPAYGTEG